MRCTQFINELVAAEPNKFLCIDAPAIDLMIGLNEGDGDLVNAIKDLPREWRPSAPTREIGFVDNEIVRVKSESLFIKDAGVPKMKQTSPFVSSRSECAQWTRCPALSSEPMRDGTKSLIHESLLVRIDSSPRIPAPLA